MPKDTNYGFEVVGRDTLTGVADGLYTDVWSHAGYAYIGTFQDSDCSNAGVFIVDMAAAVANYPDTMGATVAEIKSAPNTRINDVKVHAVGDVDVLITTQEPCGKRIPGGPISDSNSNPNGNGAPSQVGQGGISLYDVTDPAKPNEYAMTKAAQDHTLSLIRPGASPADIAAAHDDWMTSHGLPAERRLYAHGQGYDLVERPLIRADETMKLAAGMNLAVHPGYDDATVFAVICDNYLVTESGVSDCLHTTENQIFEIN